MTPPTDFFRYTGGYLYAITLCHTMDDHSRDIVIDGDHVGTLLFHGWEFKIDMDGVLKCKVLAQLMDTINGDQSIRRQWVHDHPGQDVPLTKPVGCVTHEITNSPNFNIVKVVLNTRGSPHLITVVKYRGCKAFIAFSWKQSDQNADLCSTALEAFTLSVKVAKYLDGVVHIEQLSHKAVLDIVDQAV